VSSSRPGSRAIRSGTRSNLLSPTGPLAPVPVCEEYLGFAFPAAIDDLVRITGVVFDIGCGIVPMNDFRPKLSILVEPWDEYFLLEVIEHLAAISLLSPLASSG
jgi:hypothetical protein